MPRPPRLVAPGGTVHVVTRCNNREFYFTSYALGTANPRITFHPSYVALSPYVKVRQRHYAALLAPSVDPRLDAREARWSAAQNRFRTFRPRLTGGVAWG